MGKTKKIAEERQEEVSTENKLESLGSKLPKTLKMKGLTNELNDAIVKYLSSKPYAEVANLLISLSQAPTLDVTYE